MHFVNSAGGEFEKLETLDGPAREVIRTNDQVTCYLPDSKTVNICQSRQTAARFSRSTRRSSFGWRPSLSFLGGSSMAPTVLSTTS